MKEGGDRGFKTTPSPTSVALPLTGNARYVNHHTYVDSQIEIWRQLFLSYIIVKFHFDKQGRCGRNAPNTSDTVYDPWYTCICFCTIRSQIINCCLVKKLYTQIPNYIIYHWIFHTCENDNIWGEGLKSVSVTFLSKPHNEIDKKESAMDEHQTCLASLIFCSSMMHPGRAVDCRLTTL